MRAVPHCRIPVGLPRVRRPLASTQSLSSESGLSGTLVQTTGRHSAPAATTTRRDLLQARCDALDSRQSATHFAAFPDVFAQGGIASIADPYEGSKQLKEADSARGVGRMTRRGRRTMRTLKSDEQSRCQPQLLAAVTLGRCRRPRGALLPKNPQLVAAMSGGL
jgi:hypothetical protein